jgi:hypothetical protein
MKTALLLLALAMPALPSLAAADLSESDLRALDQRCEDARTRALTPIRQQLARDCMQNKPYSANPKQECETEVSTYGNSRTGARGNVVPGLFYDLPECQQAQAAWKQWDDTRPWK